MPLTLTLAGLSVTLKDFLNNEYPRVTVQPLSAVEFSALGTPAIQGTYFEPKHLWNINAFVTKEQRDLLEAISFEFHARRRALAPCDILILDTTATVKERSPRSRAIVPNTEQVVLAANAIAYYSQFLAGITDGPKFTQSGRLDAVTMTLIETIKANA